MADYRDLLRRAIDALPENTGANRRAVYEKARGALVSQLRAIEPPLPAREITTHRLNLEDCIRQVEQEATDKLLGRLRADEDIPTRAPAPVSAPAPLPRVEEPEPEVIASEPEPQEPEPAYEPESEYEPAIDDEPAEVVSFEPEPEPEPEQQYWEPEPEIEPAPVAYAQDDEPDTFSEPVLAPATEPAQAFTIAESSDEVASIEDIIAAAESAAAPVENNDIDDRFETIAPTPAFDDAPPVRSDVTSNDDFASSLSVTPEPEPERHFITSAHDLEPRVDVPLVDVHGRPLGETADTRAASSIDDVIGAAMSSVREVDVEPAPASNYDPEVSDAQIAIDRAIAALDREARGEPVAAEAAAQDEPAREDFDETDEGDIGRGGGISGLTVFLLLAVLLLGGGGAAGFWAWREGYIDLNTIFAQSESTPANTEVAQTDEPVLAPVPEPLGNTTPDVPVTPGVNGDAMPGEELPFVETETPAPVDSEPQVAFEDRLSAEAGQSLNPTDDAISQEQIAAAASGPQSLLLEEQASGAVGAVPYSGSVEWSRGSDELGNPTIIAQATIPARNLDVRVLIRRNPDTNLPASHLMEINFTLAESFVGGSIANLPGVLLKDEELVQGQPLTGASARIVGNSFLFALSSASERDVTVNESLLRDRAWLDLAMVYGTGRRAILTLEKGEDGAAIFDAVMDAWAELDTAVSN